MKEGIKKFFVNFLILYFVLDMCGKGIHLPVRFEYLFSTYAFLSLSVLCSVPILKFLTVKCNFITYFLMNAITLSVCFVILKMFMIDFTIDSYLFNEVNIGSLHIESFTVNSAMSIAVVSIVSSFLLSVYRGLDKE
ncbi:MAG TPA: hypothetical protein PLD77_00960 [Candidatus Dojkabacteria bacterium]|nr:hypothetical protein [Candidatus Dojkabacteria bacterium]